MSKQEVLNLINNLPDDVSFDEVLYQLYLMSNVNEGISDIQDGRIFTQDEVIGNIYYTKWPSSSYNYNTQ